MRRHIVLRGKDAGQGIEWRGKFLHYRYCGRYIMDHCGDDDSNHRPDTADEVWVQILQRYMQRASLGS